jgi:predicted metal-dependent HD superfamily phosphohydrolase
MPRWKETLQKLLADYALPRAAEHLARFEEAYCEPHRRYHTLTHIEHLLSQFELASDAAGDAVVSRTPSNELLFAALYHDVVYDTNRSDNEEASAQQIGLILEECTAPSPDIDRIQEMIRATKHSGDFENADEETKLLLDADMSILGGTKDTYEEYVRNVRFEYKQVSDELWKYHRVRFLIGCLKSTRIYYSAYFSRLEKQARQNIADEALSLL